MNLEERISDVLTGIGFREITVEAAGETPRNGRFRVTCAAPLENGEISGTVDIEKLTWMSLPGGEDLRIQELEVQDRTEDTLWIHMDLRAGRPAAPRH